MAARFYLTDVFGAEKYTGNSLATFVDCEHWSTAEMQRIAREINFSETTFITAREPVDGAFPVRIFTPRFEVDFAGHPTLGSAWVIREKILRRGCAEVRLALKVGQIPMTFDGQRDARGNDLLWMRQMAPSFGDAPERVTCPISSSHSKLENGSGLCGWRFSPGITASPWAASRAWDRSSYCSRFSRWFSPASSWASNPMPGRWLAPRAFSCACWLDCAPARARMLCRPARKPCYNGRPIEVVEQFLRAPVDDSMERGTGLRGVRSAGAL